MEHEKQIPIRVSGISEGHHRLEFDVPPAAVDLPEGYGDTLHIDVDVDKSTEQVLVSVTAHADAAFDCDRCLKPLQFPVDASFVLVYSSDPEDFDDDDSDDVRAIDPDDSFVDIGGDVKDYMLLSLPMKIVCEAFGESIEECDAVVEKFQNRGDDDDSSDPRWDKLKDLNL